MGKIIAIVNQKGGVGKTTTSVNLTAALGAKNKKCLLVDIDPQGNSTSGYGIQKRSIQKSSYDLLIGNALSEETIVKTKYKKVGKIIGKAWFYKAIIVILFVIFGAVPLTKIKIMEELLPLDLGNYWYINCYLILIILIPYFSASSHIALNSAFVPYHVCPLSQIDAVTG